MRVAAATAWGPGLGTRHGGRPGERGRGTAVTAVLPDARGPATVAALDARGPPGRAAPPARVPRAPAGRARGRRRRPPGPRLPGRQAGRPSQARAGQAADRSACRPAMIPPSASTSSTTRRAGARRRRRCRRRSAPRPRTPAGRSRRAGVQLAHVGGVGRELGRARRRTPGSSPMLISGRHQRDAAVRPSSAIMSSVRPVPCSMQSMPAATSSGTDSSPKQCAVTRAPSSCARAMAAASDVGRPAGRQVARVAVDPVADELHPAVAAGAWRATSATRSAGSTSRRRSCGCSAWSGRCAGRPGSSVAGRRGRRSSGCRPATRRRGAAGCRRRGRVTACASASSVVDGAVLDRARRGSGRRPGRARSSRRAQTVTASATGSVAQHAVDATHRSRRRRRQPAAAHRCSVQALALRRVPGRNCAMVGTEIASPRPGGSVVDGRSPGAQRGPGLGLSSRCSSAGSSKSSGSLGRLALGRLRPPAPMPGRPGRAFAAGGRALGRVPDDVLPFAFFGRLAVHRGRACPACPACRRRPASCASSCGPRRTGRRAG